jgi:hypothetical protein
MPTLVEMAGSTEPAKSRLRRWQLPGNANCQISPMAYPVGLASAAAVRVLLRARLTRDAAGTDVVAWTLRSESSGDPMMEQRSRAARGNRNGLLAPPEERPDLGLVRWALDRTEPDLWCRDLLSRGRLVPSRPECPECLERHSSWRRLRLCCSCGHVGCCENSRYRHADRHFRETGHPVVRSIEPERLWSFCYVDQIRIFV